MNRFPDEHIGHINGNMARDLVGKTLDFDLPDSVLQYSLVSLYAYTLSGRNNVHRNLDLFGCEDLLKVHMKQLSGDRVFLVLLKNRLFGSISEIQCYEHLLTRSLVDELRHLL